MSGVTAAELQAAWSSVKHPCQGGRTQWVYFSRAQGDLRSAARRVARTASLRNVQALESAKRHLEDNLRHLMAHLENCSECK